MRSGSFTRLGIVIPPSDGGQTQGFHHLGGLRGVGPGILNLLRLAAHENPIGDVPLTAGFAEPALRFRVVNGDAIDDHVDSQFALDARAENSGLNPLNEFAGALTGPVLVVDFRDVDGIHAAPQGLEFVQGGVQSLGLRRGRGNNLKQRHGNGWMQKCFVKSHVSIIRR